MAQCCYIFEDLSLRTVEGRLALLLLNQSSEGMINRQRWATQAEIAARLGSVPGVVNRTLRSLADEGVIKAAHQFRTIIFTRASAMQVYIAVNVTNSGVGVTLLGWSLLFYEFGARIIADSLFL